MSDKHGDTKTESGLAFTEREMQMLAWAMQSLKSGPPEIDYEKLAAYAGMSNPRSASNAWAKIKNKLLSTCDGNTPITKKGGKKKATSEEAADGEKKTPRKRGAKAQDVDGEGTPKKKGRTPAKGKKAATDSDETVDLNVKTFDEETVKAEVPAEDEVMTEEEV